MYATAGSGGSDLISAMPIIYNLLTKQSVVQVEGGVSVIRLFAQQSHSSDTRGKTYRGCAQT